MVIKPEQERVRTLIADTVSLLCKNGLNYTKSFCIEGLLGITLDNDEIFLVNIKEVIKTDLGNEEEAASSDASDGSKSTTSKKKRKRKRKKRDQDSGDDSNEEDNSNFAQENSSSIGEPPNKNVKQEQLDDDDEDLVFVKDEPGASNFNFGQMSQFGASTSQNSSILGDMSQQGQLYGTPSTDPMPTSSQWMPDPSQLQNTPGQSQMFSPSSQQQQQPGGPNPQQSWGAMYKCPLCGKEMSTKSNLQTHIDWHQGKYRYNCSVCSKGFSSQVYLKDHMSKHHTDNDAYLFSCCNCDEKFKTYAKMRTHKRRCKRARTDQWKDQNQDQSQLAQEQSQTAPAPDQKPPVLNTSSPLLPIQEPMPPLQMFVQDRMLASLFQDQAKTEATQDTSQPAQEQNQKTPAQEEKLPLAALDASSLASLFQDQTKTESTADTSQPDSK